jgi:hypothetical protein
MPGMPLKVSDKRMQPALAEENPLTSCNPGMVGRLNAIKFYDFPVKEHISHRARKDSHPSSFSINS